MYLLSWDLIIRALKVRKKTGGERRGPFDVLADKSGGRPGGQELRKPTQPSGSAPDLKKCVSGGKGVPEVYRM